MPAQSKHSDTQEVEPTSATRPSSSVAHLTPPCPPGHPVLGHLYYFRTQQLQFLMKSVVEHGDFVRFQFGNGFKGLSIYLCADPKYISHVLQENYKGYNKQTRGFEKLRIILGNGLVTSEGALWLRQRRIAQPAFHRERIKSFAPTMVKAAEEMITERWSISAKKGTPIDIAAEMMRLTLRIVSETLMSVDLSKDADTVGQAINYLLHIARNLIQTPIDIPLNWPTPRNIKLKKSIETIDNVLLRVIEDRRKNGHPTDDLLALLMETKDEETGETMNDKQLRDEAVTIFLAGHETTANALSWTFYLLSIYPDVLRKVQNELSTVLAGRSPTFDDLTLLPYTKAVLQESMRLYPPAWTIGRGAISDDSIGGYRIPKGSIVLVSPYVVHHNPRVWANPEAFDPDRFSAENAATIPKCAYFPFGAGPRQCIGNGFAMMEAQLILATVLQKANLELLPGQDIIPEPTVTLRPKNGIKMFVHPL